HRNLRSVAAMDGPRLHSLLHFLSGFIRFLWLQIHGKAEWVRLDNLLGQCRCLASATRSVPAFCAQLSAQARVPAQEFLAGFTNLSSGMFIAGPSHLRC